MFAEKFDSDTREPVLTFSVPSTLGGGDYGILCPSLYFWAQMGGVSEEHA